MKNFLTLLLAIFLFTGCKSPEPRRPVSKSSGSFIDRSVQHNKKLIASQEKLIKEIIRKDSLHNYLTSTNGFWYYYNKKIDSTTNTPDFGDKVVFEYNIQRLDGSIIYSYADLPKKQYIMDKEDLITGLRLGLKLMKEGETVTFLLPSYNAYGYYGDSDKIGSNVPIKSTVTLESIHETTPNKKDTLN